MSRVVPVPPLAPPQGRPGLRAKAAAMLRPGPRPPCPDCGTDDALVLRATYHYHPPRALRWLAPFFPLHLAHAYACVACHQRVLINTIRPHAPVLAPRPHPFRRSAATPPQPPACIMYNRT